jgi:acyl-CoA synthetase (AMP-forming)/AMP-acid ligase II
MNHAEQSVIDGDWPTFPQLWSRVVAAHGPELALVCDDVRITYEEVDRRSRLLARGLLAAGCTKGSHVALLYPNCAEFVVGFVAATRIGAVALPLSTLSTAPEIGWLLSHSDTQVLLSAAGFRARDYPELLGEAIDGFERAARQPLQLPAAPWLRYVFFTGEEQQTCAPGFGIAALEAMAQGVDDAMLAAAEQSVRPSDWLMIVHTSGSTSHPKGVIHAHGPLLRHLENINEIRDFGADEILYSTSPWFWIAGLAYALIANLISGARMVISNEADAARVLDVIERERPTITQGHFSTVRRLAADPSFPDRDLTSIRRGLLHAISPPSIRPADLELRHSIYGMTEVGGALTMNPDESDQPEHRRGSCGNFLPGFEWRLVDPDTGRDVATGEVGELWVRSPLMMVGYYGKPRSDVFEPDGWWRSDDMGRVDEDGFFYPVSRLSDMIKTSGANVAPEEVAAVLARLTGRDCIVLGLPDEERGEIVAAVVAGEEPLDLDDLRERAGSVLSGYKIPRLVRTMPAAEIPTLSSGKIDKRALRERLLGERGLSRAGELQ